MTLRPSVAWVALFLVGLVWLDHAVTAEQLARPGRPVARNPNALFALVLTEFRRVNPSIQRVNITELRQIPNASLSYVVLAWGGGGSSGDPFMDAPFGIFVADSALSRIDRVLEVIPSPRVGDYSLWIEALNEREVIVRGVGDTFGDNATEWVYPLDRGADARAAFAAARGVTRLAPSAFPSLPATVRQRLEAEKCTVPQAGAQRTRHNVISGSFATLGQVDWAVMCSVDGNVSVRIFWGGLASCPDVRYSGRDWRILGPDAVVRRLDANELKALAEEVDVMLPAQMHHGLAIGSSSNRWYCSDGQWIRLHVIP